ncbi:MAG: RNA polymerase subunit sigma-70, partial [Geminicoccaceae bacterium]
MPDASVELARNVRRVGHLDLPGGGQVVVDGDFAYVGHMKPPHGTSILDVSDPTRPHVVAQIMLDDDHSHTHKVRVVGDLMLVNVEQNDRHFLRKGDRLPELRSDLRNRLGRAPSDAELAAELKVGERDIETLDAARERGYRDGGFKIYDIRDRTRPRLIRHQKTFGFGVHRFDADQSYAYISTEMEGYLGNILVIYDIREPSRPDEVARWWMPGQHVAGGETPTWRGYRNRLHHAMREGDELWASVWHAGIRVLDVKDIKNPRTIASYDYHPPIPEPTHTIMPVRVPIQGRRIAIAVDEEHDHVYGQPHGFIWVFDATDLNDLRPLSTFQLSEMESPWSRAPGRFGAHQYQEHLDDELVYSVWFSGGLRILDISDPFLPKEVGHFIPEPLNGHPSPQ